MIQSRSVFATAASLACLLLTVPALLPAQSSRPVPDIRQVLEEVKEHQRQLDKLRESYTYSSQLIIEDIDAGGRVKKTETEEHEDFFVNGHVIERTVKKNGRPLSADEERKESERVTKLVLKAQNTPRGEPIQNPSISISRVLDLVDVSNPRRETYHGRPAIVFDFLGRKDAKTHGLAEDASKKIKGTVWVDETDREVAHLEVSFAENFHVAAGLFANIEKGSSFHFDQAQINGELWLPAGGEANVTARVFLLKGIHQHFVERDFDYKRFKVDTEQAKDAKVKEKN